MPAVKLITIGLLSAFGIAGCDRKIETTVISNTTDIEGMTLLELALFKIKASEFKACERTDLDPLETVWTLTREQLRVADEIRAGHPIDEMVERTIEFAQDLEIEIPARDRESIVMHLFNVAADEKNAVALSEIGASLLFCYNHVRQDIPRARTYLEQAAEAGDSYAMRSLASLHLSGLTADEDSLERGRALLAKCRILGNAQCDISSEMIERMSPETP